MAALKDLFNRQLRLKRGEQGLRVVLEGTTPAASTAPARAASSDKAADASRLMLGELTALLDRAEGSRRVVRHLAAIEHTLAHKDANGLFISDLPIERLRTALREFDTLTGGTVSGGLADLRSRLTGAVTAHERRDRASQRQQPVSSFLTDGKLEVNEVQHADFDRANDAWLAPAPGGRPLSKP